MILRGILILVCFLCWGASAAETSPTEKVFSSSDQVVSSVDLADMWGLSESDINTYKTIMQGPRGNFSPGIAPPLALALESDNEADKYKYLSIYARLEYVRTQKDLEISRLYDRIFADLYPEPIINNSILFSNKAEYIRPGDRFVMFVASGCGGCRHNILNDLLRTGAFPDNPTDIYVKGLSGESDLHKWAAENSIKVGDVEKGAVTLNMMQPNTKQFLDNTDYVIYVLRDNSLFSFNN